MSVNEQEISETRILVKTTEGQKLEITKDEIAALIQKLGKDGAQAEINSQIQAIYGGGETTLSIKTDGTPQSLDWDSRTKAERAILDG